MNQPKELEWNRLFACDLPAVRPAKTPHECSEACLMACEIKCTCQACKGARHGAHLKKDVKRLDDALGLAKEPPAPLGDLGLNPQLSGRLEWPYDSK